MRRVILAAIITGSVALAAQAPAPPVTLEAASIRPAPPGSRGLVPGNWAPPTSSSARLQPMTLRTLVMYAFGIGAGRNQAPAPVGGPAWVDENLYVLTLRFSALPSIAESRALIRMLLEDRFELKWHREQRETPVYVLTVARPDGRLGPGLVPSKVDCRAYSETLTRTGRGAVAQAVAPECGIASGGAAAIVAVKKLQGVTFPRGAQLAHGTATMAEILTALQRDRENDRPIIDRTGLAGTYDLHLWWVPARSGDIAADPAEVQPLPVAVRQQLGLRMESRREPYDVIVIDSAELPEPD